MVCPRANSQITWKCRDAVASSHPTYPSSKSSTLKCSQTVAMCPIPRLMALKLICFARPCESPSNVESISRKSYDDLLDPSPLLRDWLMHPPSQLVLDLPKRCPHAIAPRYPLHEELPTAVAFTDEGKAEEVEGFRLSEPTLSR